MKIMNRFIKVFGSFSRNRRRKTQRKVCVCGKSNLTEFVMLDHYMLVFLIFPNCGKSYRPLARARVKTNCSGIREREMRTVCSLPVGAGVILKSQPAYS
jgi:hypothetical protein